MVLMAGSIPTQAKEEIKLGEVRKDEEGKGYWHKYNKEELEANAKEEERKNLDLNNDGKFDKKDKSLAAKVLASKMRPKKKKK